MACLGEESMKGMQKFNKITVYLTHGPGSVQAPVPWKINHLAQTPPPLPLTLYILNNRLILIMIDMVAVEPTSYQNKITCVYVPLYLPVGGTENDYFSIWRIFKFDPIQPGDTPQLLVNLNFSSDN